MNRLTTIFLYLFLVDGALSVANTLANLHPLGTITGILSVVVLVYAAFLFAAMVFTPRLSKRILLPPIVFIGVGLLWFILMGGKGETLFSLVEIILAAGLLIAFNHRTAGKPAISDLAKSRPGFTLKNFLLTGLMNVALTLCFLASLLLALGQKARLGFEDSTGRYVAIRPGGIALEERTFRHDGKEIRLIGMIHIARPGFYDEVAKTLPTDSSGIVLLEGVTDHGGEMPGKLDYANIARLLGIASQKNSSFSKQADQGLEETRESEASGTKPKNLEYRSADLDLSDFTPETVEFISVVGRIFACRDLPSALKEYSQSAPTLEHDIPFVKPDILDKRNAHLLDEIKQALDAHTIIVVPWGAQHMPAIEKAIQEWGFVETSRARHTAVLFKNKALVTLITLLDRLPGEPE